MLNILRFPRTAALSVVFLWLSVCLNAQLMDRLFNPKLKVPITHAPGLGMQINKVAFGDASGQGSTEFTEALTSRFVGANVEVLERSRLHSILREQNFSLTGHVDKSSAVAMGKIVGPAVVVFVTGSRYTTEQKRLSNDWKDRKGVLHRTYVSRTQAFVRLSVRTVDLATGRIFAARVLQADPSFENKSDDTCCAEYPEPFTALDAAMNTVVEEVSRMFLPWTSIEEVYYFDDNDCNLKDAFRKLKAGDGVSALATSIKNVEVCEALASPNPKALAHAYHNVGISHFLAGRHDAALKYLERAEQAKSAGIHRDAMAAVRLAAQQASEMQRIEERVTLEAEQVSRAQTANAKAEAAAQLTNDQIVEMTKAGLPLSVVLSKIKTSPCQFDTGTDALIKLKKAAVPDDVIVAMMECKK
jgi:hypothetical protein